MELKNNKMENKNWRQKIIEVIKKKDNRFWLMIFVVFSTLSILSIWVMDIRNVFSSEVSLSEEISFFKIDDSNSQLDYFLEDFDSFIDNINLEEDSNIELSSNTSSTDILEDSDLDKIIEAVNLKLSEQEDENIIISDINNSQDEKYEMNSSSDPILSLELDESDQNLVELKKRIEELEKKLGE